MVNGHNMQQYIYIKQQILNCHISRYIVLYLSLDQSLITVGYLVFGMPLRSLLNFNYFFVKINGYHIFMVPNNIL